MFQGLVERKIAPSMVYHWLTHQMFWSLCQCEDNREFDVLTDVILLYREFNPAAKLMRVIQDFTITCLNCMEETISI